MVEVVVENLTRRFGDAVALNDVSFTVRSGEFLTLLGPSGCGKSTTLSALAGLDRPTSGVIKIGGQTVFDSTCDIFVDAQYRRLGLMFQSYALWPHMTVFRNLDFALELNGVRGREARDRIQESLELVDMAGYDARYPGELSGGQQQRIALARTMVYRPKILLLDEPLSNLDAKLRDRARLWLADIQRKLGMTTVFVTHDQAEALSLSDRIIVMNNGRIAQIGTPEGVYNDPADPFVADFVGASNVISADIAHASDGRATIRLDGWQDVFIPVAPAQAKAGTTVTMSVRPESLSLHEAAGPNTVPCEIVSRSYLGPRVLLVVKVGDTQLRVETTSDKRAAGNFLRISEETIKTFA